MMATVWEPEAELLQHLDGAVDEILTTQKTNGQFGTEPWISTDQNVLWPLAVAWSRKDSRHRGDEGLLDAIVRGGLALREAQDEAGMWLFRKKDYSEWGPIRMPWAYSRWIRALSVIRDAMPADARAEWEEGLLLGYGAIAEEDLDRVHNIPAHHAMGLYCAGQVFERSPWCDQAVDFLHRVAEAQSPLGWWAEHDGPVVAYNFVYTEALGAYHAMSDDGDILAALDRAATYHATFTYPDGSCVETIDGRNPYHHGIRLGNAGLTRSAAGRGWTAQQHRLYLAEGLRFDADYAASMLAYAEAGDAEPPSGARVEHTARMGGQAITRRHVPWFACVSAYTVPIPLNRWGQDRQSFVSVYHDELGVIAGGGNTKLQPLWSTFTVGDTDLLSHTQGEEEPDFSSVDGLIHCPDSGQLGDDDQMLSVDLSYGKTTCRLEVELTGMMVTLRYSVLTGSTDSVSGHLTLLPRLGERVSYGSEEEVLGDEPIDWTSTAQGSIRHAGWRLLCPAGARLRWPVLPHNPYRKDGDATVEEGRLVLSLPLAAGRSASVEICVDA